MRSTQPSLLILAALSCALGQSAIAQDTSNPKSKGLLPVPDYSGDLLHRPALTGDWGGARTTLADRGVQFNLDFTQYVQSIVDGGRDRTTRYGGHFDFLVRLDLMRMDVLPGALVTVRAESRYGDSVNAQAGPVLPVNTAAFFPLTATLDEDEAITLTELNYTQFLSETFGVVVGRLQTLDADPNEFASGRGKSQFMHANFLFNSVAALRLPYSTLGAGVVWLPNPNVKVTAIVVNTVDSSTTTGLDDFDNGQTATVEADFQYRVAGLPGGMNVGGLYSFDQDFAELGRLIVQPGQGLALDDERETWAVYWSAWQYLFVEAPNDKPIDLGNGMPDHQGVGVFARFGVADQDTNPVEWSASGGVGGRGIIPSRGNDTFGIGYYYTRFQTDRITGVLGLDDHGQGLEAFYNIAITPAAHLTFDVQVQDVALPDTDTAVILGVRLNVSL